MLFHMYTRRIEWLVLLGALSLELPLLAQESPTGLQWFKGNTHTHTLNSDGDATPSDVVTWYREHGYNFLALTDHDYVTAVDGLNAVHGAEGLFVVLRGEEVSDEFEDKPLHIAALNPATVVEPQGGDSVSGALQNDIDAIRAAQGVPHINHPNFGWAIQFEDLAKIEGCRLIEIFNGHPRVNNFGGGGFPSTEEVWDRLLSEGKVVFGMATDDAHGFQNPWDPEAARPGQGWVVVRAAELSPLAVLGALEKGDFYASTGVELEDIAITKDSYSVTVKPYRETKYRIQFIGDNGTLLLEVPDIQGSYQFNGSEKYVRAKVLDSNGKFAWLQPAFPAHAE